MNREERYKRKMVLLLFLQVYLSKPNLHMKDLLNNLDKSIRSDIKITINQLNALMKFLERERMFKGYSRDKIIDYFGCLIKGYKKETVNDSAELHWK